MLNNLLGYTCAMVPSARTTSISSTCSAPYPYLKFYILKSSLFSLGVLIESPQPVNATIEKKPPNPNILKLPLGIAELRLRNLPKKCSCLLHIIHINNLTWEHCPRYRQVPAASPVWLREVSTSSTLFRPLRSIRTPPSLRLLQV